MELECDIFVAVVVTIQAVIALLAGIGLVERNAHGPAARCRRRREAPALLFAVGSRRPSYAALHETCEPREEEVR